LSDTPASPAPRTIPIEGAVRFGPGCFTIVAGPCAVETEEQLTGTALRVAAAGASMLRGGAFKPRTSPKSFQGLGAKGLDLLRAASAASGLPVVTEVLDPRDVELVAASAAMLQIGSRNMQNFALLREVAKVDRPVLLKRGAAATLDELLAAADYLLEGGNQRVVLCERGVRGFDPSTRYLLDLAAVPTLKQRSSLPVIVDPSHGTGRRELVVPMALAAFAAGADGIIVEVHPDPARAQCDGRQALLPTDFEQLVGKLAQLAPVLGRPLGARSARAKPGNENIQPGRPTEMSA
jgi:3-deoxy-7-phosphoheptulonate synthase